LLILVNALAQVAESVVPGFVALARGGSELDRTAGRTNEQTLLMKPRGKWVAVLDFLDRFDCHTLAL
jgi:hypothetical protein